MPIKLNEIKNLMMEEEFVRFTTKDKPHESLQVKSFNNAIQHQGRREIDFNDEELEAILINVFNKKSFNYSLEDVMEVKNLIMQNIKTLIIYKKNNG